MRTLGMDKVAMYSFNAFPPYQAEANRSVRRLDSGLRLDDHVLPHCQHHSEKRAVVVWVADTER